MDQEAALRIGRDFPLLRETLVASLFFIIPGLLVAIGSYVHAVRNKAWARLMLSIAVVLVVAVFVFLFVILAFFRVDDVWFRLNVSLPGLAVVTLVIALVTGRESYEFNPPG